MERIELKAVFGLIVLALLTRLMPHPPNFAPITSIALFTGHHFVNKRWAIFIPIFALFISDLYLGLHALIPVVYLSFVFISIMGLYAKKLNLYTVLGASTLFFVLSNLGVWYLSYPLSWEGLSTCFVLAIPFFANAIAGDLFYTAVLQFSFEKLKRSSKLFVN